MHTAAGMWQTSFAFWKFLELAGGVFSIESTDVKHVDREGRMYSLKLTIHITNGAVAPFLLIYHREMHTFMG